jgi:NADPH-dependent 2,4-dienoyl-CoA reductase/sulfur reductase-like enzyme
MSRMPSTEYLLIGGGLAASRAARRIRKLDADGAITLVTAEPHAPYDRPPLSKEFLRGEVAEEKLFYQSPDELRGSGVDLVTATRVVALDPDAHSAALAGGERYRFQKALLATGGRPVALDVPGADLDGVHYLRTLDDAKALAAEAGQGKRIAVVGAGFIGMEVASSLTQLGCEVEVVETAPRVWARFADETLSRFFQRYCEERGVRFRTGERTTAIRGNGRVTALETASGTRIPCDAVLIAVGIRPNVELAADAGLDVDDGIVVDASMRTSHPDVYAAGDAVRFPDPIFGRRRRVEHWGHADASGRVAGESMAGAERVYDSVSYVWSDVFDLHLEFAGDEQTCDRTLLRGDPASGSFTLLYLRRDRLTAFFSVGGNPRDLVPLKKLIKDGAPLTGRERELADPGFPVRDLL